MDDQIGHTLTRGKHPNERDAKLCSLLSVMKDLLDEQE